MYTSHPLHIVHTESSLGWGGQEIRILTEAKGMAERGHVITLICPPQAKINEIAQNLEIEVVNIPIARKNVRGLNAMHAWLRRHHPDIINTHSSTDSWLTALACTLINDPPPIIRTRHISASIPNNMATRWLYQKASRHVVTTGEALREQLIKHNHYKPSTLTSVPTGINTYRFVPGDKQKAREHLGLRLRPPIIGIVATLRSWKGHRYLLDAFLRLENKETQLVIVGDGPQRESLQEEIRHLQLKDRVMMPGNQDDVVPWLQAMDVFVLPSYANEGVPQAVLQAMMCGLPIVTTPVGSILEAIKDKETGLIVPAKNSEALKAAIEQLLNDPVQRRVLGDNAHELAKEKFGLPSMLDKMESIFFRIAYDLP